MAGSRSVTPSYARKRPKESEMSSTASRKSGTKRRLRFLPNASFQATTNAKSARSARADALARERDEAASTLMAGETDPETGLPVTWKEKADQWNFAFIMAKRRAERAEAERDGLSAQLKTIGVADGKRAEEDRRAEGRASDGLIARRRLHLAPA